MTNSNSVKGWAVVHTDNAGKRTIFHDSFRESPEAAEAVRQVIFEETPSFSVMAATLTITLDDEDG